MTIAQELDHFAINNIVELFELDLTSIGGTETLRFSPHIDSSTLWRGNTYLPLPVQVTSINRSLEGAPPRMTFAISNINRTVMSDVITLGDLVGAEVIRWRTLAMFLDGQPDADQNQHWPIERYGIIQMTELSRDTISFVIGTSIDTPSRKIPRRQILRDDVEGALWAPMSGLSGLNRR